MTPPAPVLFTILLFLITSFTIAFESRETGYLTKLTQAMSGSLVLCACFWGLGFAYHLFPVEVFGVVLLLVLLLLLLVYLGHILGGAK